MTGKSFCLNVKKHGLSTLVAAVLLLSFGIGAVAEPAAAADNGTLLITTTTENGSVTTTGDGKAVSAEDSGSSPKVVSKIGKIPLYKSKKNLGAYIDKQMSKHKKKIVFYSTDSRLMSSDNYNSVPYDLAYYSFMLAGIRPRVTTVIDKDEKHLVKVKKNGKTSLVHPTKYTLKIKYSHSRKKDRKFYNKVRKVVRIANKKKSSRAKAKYVNKYVIDHVRGNKNAWRNTSAYSVLMKGQAACQGYAEAYTVLARACGLKSEVIIGRLKMGGGKYSMHAWNIVKIGRKWYYLDTSWNDQSGSRRNKYLLQGRRKFEKKRKPLSVYKTKKWRKAHPMKN